MKGSKQEYLMTQEVGNDAIKKAKWKDVKAQLIMLDISMDMQEDNLTTPTINKISKSTYKKGQKFDKKNAENTPECNKARFRVCNETGHHGKVCPLKCNLEGCSKWRWYELTKEHMAKVRNKKKSSSN